jgi:hypothetical protein
LARQPIFDRSEKVFGYELLFRNGLEQAFQGDKEVPRAARLTVPCSSVLMRCATVAVLSSIALATSCSTT